MKVLCVRQYSCIECTYILSCNPHNHPFREHGYKKQILKENVDLVVMEEYTGSETVGNNYFLVGMKYLKPSLLSFRT